MAAPARDAGLLFPWSTMTDWRRSDLNPGLMRGVALLLAALGFLAVPVTYTGGQQSAHPHAILQLVAEAARGAPSHHAPDVDTLHGEPIHRTQRLIAVPDGMGVVSLPSGFSERLAVLSVTTAFGLSAVLLFVLPSFSTLGRLLGRQPRPLTPPPRLMS